MPKGVRKTAVKAKADDEEVKSPLAEEASETVEVEVEEETTFVPVTHEGKTVVKILNTGHTASDYHCEMSDRTTMHVPKSKFNLDE